MASECSCSEVHARLDALFELVGSLHRTLAEVENEEASFVSEDFILLEEALVQERAVQETDHDKLREVFRKKAKDDRARAARRALRAAQLLLEAAEKNQATVAESSGGKENEKCI